MEVLESVLGHTFQNRRLLTEALTHGSVGYEAQRQHVDNQRLEFLGDAVLQLTLSEILFQKLPDDDEGALTKLRAQIVSTKALATVARRLNLGSFLIMGRGEDANGGRNRENSLADALEAVIGAVYLDGGLPEAQKLARHLFQKDLETLLLNPQDENPKGRLQEIIQAVGPTPPSYKIVGESGPDHSKSFQATVNWLDCALGLGSGRSKKEAEVEAARTALLAPDLQERLKALAEAHFKATKISTTTCEQTGNNPPQLCEQDS